MKLLVVLGFIGSTVVYVFFVGELERVLAACSTKSRTLSPRMAWLMLIPLFNLLWQFVVVIHVSKSLQNEFGRRNLMGVPRAPLLRIGLAMCILELCALVPRLQLLGAAGGVCWICYWINLERCSDRL